MKKARFVCVLTLLIGVRSSSLFASTVGFAQINLVSDVPGLAAVTDHNLRNPWGLSFSATSPFWASNQASNTASVYTGAGVPQAILVTVPGGPTGQVQNSAGTGNFNVNGTAASFIFDGLNGTITAWNASLGTTGTAATMVTTPGAVYTGLAIGSNANGNVLYAANFTAGGGINVFNSSFGAITTPGAFVDPNLPAGFAPYNIQLLNGNLYVEYAQVGGGVGNASRGAGLGFVDVFDVNGNLLQRLVSGSVLNAPWGVVFAPAGFGSFGGDLLVGNFGDGTINAFNPTTGAYIGTLDDQNGNPIVNQDLWALEFRTNGGSGSNPNALYFDAGINREVDGLFGELVPTPEPSTWALGAIGLIALAGLSIRRSRENSAQSSAP
jgi:uncharacterized protein (TIGR03118 family)